MGAGKQRHFVCANDNCANDIVTGHGGKPNCCSGCESHEFIEVFVCPTCSSEEGNVMHAPPLCTGLTTTTTNGEDGR